MFAACYLELLPLIELIKNGDAKSVQTWIANGKPIDLIEHPKKGQAKKTPLQCAVDRGFYSIVEILINAGAPLNLDWRYSAMKYALEKRRFDIVQLLVEKGYEACRVDSRDMFASWKFDVMKFLIDHGANVVDGLPLARALIDRVRPALNIFKEYRVRISTLQEQGDMALRHHCNDGNTKWVSLLLWAGANPNTRGESEPDAKLYPNEPGLTAIGEATLFHPELLKIKRMQVPNEGPAFEDLLKYGYHGNAFEVVKKKLDAGVNLNINANGGCPLMQNLVEHLQQARSFVHMHNIGLQTSNADSEASRECLKSIHILAMRGAKWVPRDDKEIAHARRSLMRMTSDYTMEFVWIMAKYGAAKYDDVKSLIRTDGITRKVHKHHRRLKEILESWPTSEPLE